MSDYLVWACYECNNAVATFNASPPEHDCPACGHDNVFESTGGIDWKLVGQVR